jgi:hypothetical protein
MLPNPNYPIRITAKATPMVAQFSEGYSQRSSFESIKSVNLNFLGLTQLEVDNLISTCDTAGGVDLISWDFRYHYQNKKWKITQLTQKTYDFGRLSEVDLSLQEVPLGLPGLAAPTAPIPLNIVPNQAPMMTRNYNVRSSGLGFFEDRQREPIKGKIDKLQLLTSLNYDNADILDLKLEQCRGVYPLLYDGKKWVCSDWSIDYQPEDYAEVSIELTTY